MRFDIVRIDLPPERDRIAIVVFDHVVSCVFKRVRARIIPCRYYLLITARYVELAMVARKVNAFKTLRQCIVFKLGA